jgi:hypothetical protein
VHFGDGGVSLKYQTAPAKNRAKKEISTQPVDAKLTYCKIG